MIAALGIPLVLVLALGRSYAWADAAVLCAMVGWFECARRSER